MTLHWADLAFVVAIVIAGGATIYLLLVGKLRRMLAQDRRDIEHRLTALTEAIRQGVPVSAEGIAATEVLDLSDIEANSHVVPAPVVPPIGVKAADNSEEREEVPSEIRVAIAAAAIAALGNHARVRSARRIPSTDVVSPWTQQGRVIVQSSHNLRTQGSR